MTKAAMENTRRMVQERAAARAEVERSKARVEDYQRAVDSLNEGLAYQRAENKRLTRQVDELVKALRTAKFDGYRPDVVALLARIDAGRAGNLRTDANR